jgi:hypothetical protein
MIKTDNFCIGFEYPRTKTQHGVIYFRGDAFANTWVQTEDWGKHGGRWIVNRDGKAFEMKFPNDCPSFETAEKMLDYLETWFDKYTGLV